MLGSKGFVVFHLMVWCKTAVSPLLTQWRCYSLALSHLFRQWMLYASSGNTCIMCVENRMIRDLISNTDYIASLLPWAHHPQICKLRKINLQSSRGTVKHPLNLFQHVVMPSLLLSYKHMYSFKAIIHSLATHIHQVELKGMPSYSITLKFRSAYLLVAYVPMSVSEV